MTAISHSGNETEKLGEQFSKKLKPGDIVCLYGDLGFGKTTFVKGVAKGLGISGRVISPTFVVIRAHDVQNKEIKTLYHIDLYRIESEKELQEIGIKEILEDHSSVKLIEWPNKLIKKPFKRWEVVITLNNNDTRTLNIIKYE